MTVTQKVIVGQSVYRSFGQSVFVKQSVNLQVSLTIYQSITISHCNLAINSSVVCQAANQSVSQSINPRRMKHATLVKAFGLVQESAESCAFSIFFSPIQSHYEEPSRFILCPRRRETLAR